MAELTPKEFLQPWLLDRLQDDNPAEAEEPRDGRIWPVQKLKKSVLRDLEWLLNTGCLSTTQDLSDYPQVKHSVFNYGIQDLTGTTISSVDSATFEDILRQAILDFEPRITPKSLRVRVTHMEPNNVTFEIEGELWTLRIPERLYLKTRIDLETGNAEIIEG
jgi:type VI secretion system protein ImpF